MHLVDRVPRPLLADLAGDGIEDVGVGRTGPQRVKQIGVSQREKAVAELPVGGETNAVAGLAERLR